MREYVELQVLRPVPKQPDMSFRAATKPSLHPCPASGQRGGVKNSLLCTFIMGSLALKMGRTGPENLTSFIMHNQMWLVSQKATMRNAYPWSDPRTLEGPFRCGIWFPPMQNTVGSLML